MAESPFESLKAAVEEIGVTKIAVALVVLLAVVGFILFFPRAGSVVVTVSALDGDALPGAEVTLSNSDGDVVATEYSDDSGRVAFNVAPGDYSASIDAGAGFKPLTKSVSLASGGEASVAADVERVSSVSLAPQESPSFLPLSCEKKIVFELKNSGQSDEAAKLVADGGLKDVFSPPAQPVAVPAGGSNFVEALFLVTKAKPGDSLKGKVRVKGTRNGVDFAFVVDEAPKISVSPQSITGSAAPGGMIQQKLVVSNAGSEPIEIPQESIRVEGDYANSYRWTYYENRIEAGGKASWWLALVVPENAYGKLVGAIKIPLPCKTAAIDIDTEAKAE
jgi:hypothetical protein